MFPIHSHMPLFIREYEELMHDIEIPPGGSLNPLQQRLHMQRSSTSTSTSTELNQTQTDILDSFLTRVHTLESYAKALRNEEWQIKCKELRQNAGRFYRAEKMMGQAAPHKPRFFQTKLR